MVRRLLPLCLALFYCGAVFAAPESFDSPETAADLALCAAVFKVAAATAPEERYRKSFNARRDKLMKRLKNALKGATDEVASMAEQGLLQQLKEERARDEEQGAAKYLAERVGVCDQTFPP